MPIYEYACRTCGHEFEELQKISEKPLLKCPSCGNKSLVKKVSAAAFRLKGGGWYETDFKTKAKKDNDAAPVESGGKNSDSSSSSEASSSSEEGKKTKDDKSGSKDKSKSTKDASSAKKTPKKES